MEKCFHFQGPAFSRLLNFICADSKGVYPSKRIFTGFMALFFVIPAHTQKQNENTGHENIPGAQPLVDLPAAAD